jgi:hypothetical protein
VGQYEQPCAVAARMARLTARKKASLEGAIAMLETVAS